MFQHILIFLLIIGPTIQYRIELGAFSVTLAEPIILLASLILIVDQIRRRGSVFLARTPIVGLLLLMCFWALIVRPLDGNLTRGLSDARDWIIPTLGFLALISTVKTNWRRWSALVVGGVVIQSLLGIYQHLSDSARPFVNALSSYKTGFTLVEGGESLELVSFAVGLFVHPNGFAIYLFGGLMLLISWPVTGKQRFAKYALVALIGVCLFWTYAKASLLVMGVAIVWYGLQSQLRSGAQLLALTGIGVLVGSLALLALLPFLPAAILSTFYWRLGLWETGLWQIGAYPETLLVGNGMDYFGQIAYHAQPHNVYVFMTLEYGLFGLVWTLTLMLVIVWQGWSARRRGLFQREPMLAGLWIYLIGFAAVGLVESNLQTLNDRGVFLLFYACFLGLLRDQRLHVAEHVSERVVQDERATIARPGAVGSLPGA